MLNLMRSLSGDKKELKQIKMRNNLKILMKKMNNIKEQPIMNSNKQYERIYNKN